MKKVKICEGFSYSDLEKKVNEALSEIKSDKVDIVYLPTDKHAISIEYEIHEAYQDRVCCECAYWEDTGHYSLVNFCVLTGKRKRYICPACADYKDIRK